MLPTEQRRADARPESARDAVEARDLETIYAEHFAFVWRNVRRLGVPAAVSEDLAQDIFLVVHRKLSNYQGGSLRAWLFAIARGVVANWRRSAQRDSARMRAIAAEEVQSHPQPHAQVERAEAVRTLYALLDELDEEKREVFVLAELEQMPVPEIASALDVNTNTVYSRLRLARAQFKAAVVRYQARERRRVPCRS